MAAVNVGRWLSAALVVVAGATALTGCAGSGAPARGRPWWRPPTCGAVWPRRHRPPHRRQVHPERAPISIRTRIQASPSDAAAITDAALVVYNGGGYDPWVDQVLARHRGVKSVDAYSSVPNATPGDQPPNEHVFYDLGVAKSVASTIADRMAAIDPANAADYRANAAAFCRGADAIAISEHAIASAYPDAGVIATEPVAYYLLTASGLVNRTPAAFTAANENETDPSPADMASVLDLIDHRQVSALLVNPQTSTAAIKRPARMPHGARVCRSPR